MTLPENARLLRTGELPPVGSSVYVPVNTTDIVGEWPATGWQTVRDTDEGSSTVAVKSKDGYTAWVLAHNLLVLDKEADTAATTITTTTQVTLPRPATAAQVEDALAHVDGHHEVAVQTYADRIEIHAHHEETRG